MGVIIMLPISFSFTENFTKTVKQTNVVSRDVHRDPNPSSLKGDLSDVQNVKESL